MTLDELQPMLFADLPIPPAPPEAPPKPPRRRGVVAVARRMLQLALDFDFRELGAPRQTDAFFDDDEDTAYDYPQHRRVVAGREPPPRTSGPASIWAFAATVRDSSAPRLRAKDAAPAAPKRGQKVGTVIREPGGVTRCIGAQYPANRWDEERLEQERIRRAKQRPPKPTKKARTKSAKLIELIGTSHDD